MNTSGRSKGLSFSNPRRQRALQRSQRRRLFAESLEDRRLLAANPFQNPVDAEDVDGDGSVTTMDLVTLVADLQINGSRALILPSAASAGGEGEGEGEGGEPHEYLDVTADGYVTSEDLLQVVSRLVAEGQAGAWVMSDIRVTAPGGGAQISTADVGSTIQVNTFIQDIRPVSDPNPEFPELINNDRLLVAQAYFDYSFEANVSVVPDALDDDGTDVTFLHGPEYRNFTSGNNPVFPFIELGDVETQTLTKINDLGGFITDFINLTAAGGDEHALVSFQLSIDSSGLTAVDDTQGVEENAIDAEVDVLANDSVIDTIQIRRGETDALSRNVLVQFNDGTAAGRRVAAADIMGTEPTISLNNVALGGLTIVSVSTGTATVGNNGTRDVILFTPDGLNPSEIVYTVSDGVGGTETATANITVGPVNDPPSITSPASVGVDEEQLFTFNGADAISVDDDAVAPAGIQVELGVGNGTLTLASTTGLTFINGTANGQANVDFQGTVGRCAGRADQFGLPGRLELCRRRLADD